MKPIFAFVLLLICLSCGTDKSIADTTGLETPAADTPDPNDGNTAIYDVDADDPYLISNGYFLGLTPGGSLAEFSDGLRSGVLQTGEGDFDVFYIDSAEGDELGYVIADPRDEQTIGAIYITSKDVVTEKGVRVGISFAELQQRVGKVEVHGSEIEGYTYAYTDGMAYRLDSGNWSYEVDMSTIAPETEIIEIVIDSMAE